VSPMLPGGAGGSVVVDGLTVVCWIITQYTVYRSLRRMDQQRIAYHAKRCNGRFQSSREDQVVREGKRSIKIWNYGTCGIWSMGK